MNIVSDQPTLWFRSEGAFTSSHIPKVSIERLGLTMKVFGLLVVGLFCVIGLYEASQMFFGS